LGIWAPSRYTAYAFDCSQLIPSDFREAVTMLLANAANSASVPQTGFLLGTVLAVVCSWQRSRSLFWAIFAGILSWLYVIYFYVSRRQDEVITKSKSDAVFPSWRRRVGNLFYCIALAAILFGIRKIWLSDLPSNDSARLGACIAIMTNVIVPFAIAFAFYFWERKHTRTIETLSSSAPVNA